MNEERLVQILREKKLRISFAESATGGLLSAFIINVPCASYVIERSFVTYSNEAKEELLGVKKETIEKYDVVSLEVAHEMVLGLSKLTTSEVLVSVTGYAGPDSVNGIKAGTVCFGFMIKGTVFTKRMVFEGLSRNEVREAATNYVISQLIDYLLKN